METWGDRYPRLKDMPGYEAMAAKPTTLPLHDPAPLDPKIRDAVNACPERGPELPVSAYADEGCCSGPTRWECRAAKGEKPGMVSLAECLACKGG